MEKDFQNVDVKTVGQFFDWSKTVTTALDAFLTEWHDQNEKNANEIITIFTLDKDALFRIEKQLNDIQKTENSIQSYAEKTTKALATLINKQEEANEIMRKMLAIWEAPVGKGKTT